MNLKRRLRALERAIAPPSTQCESCGHGSGAPVRFVVRFPEESNGGPDFCPQCRRPLIIRLKFDKPLRAV